MTASRSAPAAPDVTLRQSARWLPADMDTPISLFLGMCHEHHGILLESAEVDGRWGRYSILACDFLLQATCRDGLLALDTNDDRLRPFAALNGMPFTEGLRTLMHGLHLENPEGITLPPITRALYGYFGYGMGELLQQEAGKLPAPKRRRRQPLSCREPCSCSTTCTTGCARSASANTGT